MSEMNTQCPHWLVRPEERQAPCPQGSRQVFSRGVSRGRGNHVHREGAETAWAIEGRGTACLVRTEGVEECSEKVNL